MTDTAPVATSVAKRSPWAALGLLAIVQLMVVLDASITNVALPTIGNDLNMDEEALSWVINAYVLMFGGFLLLGGRLGDIKGRRLVFMVGLLLFSLGSLLGGLSSSEWQIIAARALQGFGGAFLAPGVLAITAVLFTEGSERNKALGVLGAIAGAGGAIGVLLGGVLTEFAGWEWVFFVNVPIGVAAFIVTPMLLHESHAEGAENQLDLPGAITSTLAIGSLVYALVDANDAGWTSAQTIGLLTASVVLGAVFILIEQRTSHPLVRLGIFRNKVVTGANIIGLAVGASLFSAFFFITFYMQTVLDKSALDTGLGYLPLAISIVISAGFASGLTTKLGIRKVILSGLALTTAGIAWFTQISVDGSWTADVLGPSVVMGAGLGFVFVPLMIAAVTGVTDAETGLASGLINTVQQVGGAAGLAALFSVFANTRSPESEEILTRASQGMEVDPADMAAALASYTEGLQAAFIGGAAIAAIGLVLGWILIRPSAEDEAKALAQV